jgi:hypothetical protein
VVQQAGLQLLLLLLLLLVVRQSQCFQTLLLPLLMVP